MVVKKVIAVRHTPCIGQLQLRLPNAELRVFEIVLFFSTFLLRCSDPAIVVTFPLQNFSVSMT